MRPRIAIASLLSVVLLLPTPATPASLPQSEREALKDRAESLLIQSQRRVAETAHVIAVTDAPQPEAAAILAANVESVFASSYRLFDGEFPARPDSPKVVAFLFASQRQYENFVAHRKSWGSYLSPGLIAFHQELWDWMRPDPCGLWNSVVSRRA